MRRRSSARWRSRGMIPKSGHRFSDKIMPSEKTGADVAGAVAAKSEQIFAANRAVGRVALSVKQVAGKTRRAEVHEAGSLRVRCPGAPAEELEAVLINTAGGVA